MFHRGEVLRKSTSVLPGEAIVEARDLEKIYAAGE